MKKVKHADVLLPLQVTSSQAVLVLSTRLKLSTSFVELLAERMLYNWKHILADTFQNVLSRESLYTADVLLLVFETDDGVSQTVGNIHALYPDMPLVVAVTVPTSDIYHNHNLLQYGVQEVLYGPLLHEPVLSHALLNAIERWRVLSLVFEQKVFLNALRDITLILNSVHNLNDLMNGILDTIGRIIPHTAANIALLEGDVCRIAFQRGYDQFALPVDSTFPSTWNAWTVMMYEQRPYLIADTSQDPHWYLYPDGRWIRSYLGAPIISHGNVIGFINLDSNQEKFFTDLHRQHLQDFAEQVSIAVSNATAYKTLEENNHEIAMLHRAYMLLVGGLNEYQTIEEMANHATLTITETFGHVDCGLMLVDIENSLLKRVARHGLYGISASEPLPLNGKGLVPEAVRKREIIYVPDVRSDERYIPTEPRTLSELVIPLINKDEVLGVLDLQSAQLDAFSPREINILQVFANRVAIMLDNVRLYATLRQYAESLEMRVESRTLQLQHARDQVEAIFNNSIDAIILTYPDGKIRQTNPACEALFGYGPDDLFGESIQVLFVPDDHAKLDKMYKQLLNQHGSDRMELTAQRADGLSFPVDVAISFIQDENLAWQRVLFSLRDMTRIKETELQLARALEHQEELNNLKTRFIRAANHEFKTPLTGMLMQTENLVNYWDRMEDDERHQLIENIYQLMQRQRAQVDSILKLQKLSNDDVAFNPQLTDVESRCREIIERTLFTMQVKHPVEYSWQGMSKSVMIDRDLLEIVLTNLVSNAIKYSRDHTPIEVQVTILDEQMQLLVRDYGIGIPENVQPRLFQPFYRAPNATSIEGTGLGLSLIKSYIENYGGAIRFESQVNVGTTFVVQLPLLEKDATE